MKIRFYISMLLISFVVFCFAADGSAGLKIDSVNPTNGIKGRDLPTTITGSGFDANTRVSMYPKAIVGSVTTPKRVYGVAISGSTAYLSDGAGLWVIDVGNRTNPRIIGSLDIPGGISGVSISGSSVYAVSGYETTGKNFRIIDVSDPRHPEIKGSFEIPGAYGVAASGNFVYTIGHYDGIMQIIDVRNPENIRIVGSVDIGQYSGGRISISGSTAYIEAGSGFKMVNIGDPEKPEIIGTVNMPNYVWDLSVSGSIAYGRTTLYTGFYAVDIADPQNPKITKAIETPRTVNAVSVSGSTAYVADSTGLLVIDLDLITSGVIGAIDMPSPVDTVENFSVSGSLAYVLSYYGSVQVVNLGDPQNPEIIGAVKILPSTGQICFGQIWVSDSILYVITADNDGYSTLRVIDVSIPENPVMIGYLDMPSHVLGSVLSGSLIYMANSYSGLQIVDVGNPKKPVIIGSSIEPSYASPNDAWDVSLSGSIAYVDTRTGGVRMVDVSDPKHPEFIGTADADYPRDVSVSGNFAYAVSSKGLQVKDMSDPKNPKTIGAIPEITSAGKISISGTKACVAYQNGTYLIDISKPENPVIIGTIEKSGKAAVIGDNILTANGSRLSVIPAPVEVKPQMVNDTTLSVTLPGPSVPGKYTVRVFNNNGDASELAGAVTFASEEPESITVGEDLALNICARYHGQTFGFVLNYAPAPHGMSGVFWKADLSTFRQIDSTSSSCIEVGDDLALNIRAGYHGAGYAFTMSFYPYPDAASASEFFWKADPASFRVIY